MPESGVDRADLAYSRNIFLDGIPLWERCWGRVYPTELLTYDNATFRFYNTRGALNTFFPTLFPPYILLRREYEAAYEYLENEERMHATEYVTPKHILTGQPGIGAHTVLTTFRVPLTSPTSVCR
jgi:hypothetical protein